jgi:transketolase
MRQAFTEALVQLAQADPNVLLLTGDHGYALFDEFRRLFPDQFINAGIAEQNMIGMAAGLARLGFRPFVYALAAFVPIRTVEQIKLDVAHDGMPVVLIGDGAGFVYSSLGASHHSTEDMACMRAIPGLQVLSPADDVEMTASMHYAYHSSAPLYLRIGKSELGRVHGNRLPGFNPGNLLRLRSGRSDRPGLIATGSMVHIALSVGTDLGLSVWSAPFIKPLNVESIRAAICMTNGLVTLEEHSIVGGLGSAIAEITSEWQPTRILRIGVLDQFPEVCGTYSFLLQHNGLDAAAVRLRVKAFADLLAT